MSRISVALASAVLCSALPVHAQQKPVNLPDGPGKEAVQTYCSGCHGLARVVAAGYPQAYWHTTMRMKLNYGVAIPQDQVIPMIDYLAKNFPEKPMPVAKVVLGPVQVNFREWQVPTPGSRPHDPLATRDGAIWYTGQLSNKLGRVDPKTEQFQSWVIPSGGYIVRKMDVTPDGNPVMANSTVNFVGMVELK